MAHLLLILFEVRSGSTFASGQAGRPEEAWRNAAKKINTYPWKLDEPIWTVGSKLCSKRLCGNCPVEDLCSKVKGIKFKGAIMLWEKPSD